MFLERVIIRNTDALLMERFDSVRRVLLNQQFSACQDWVVRWLLSGEYSLARSAVALLSNVGGAPTNLTVDLNPYLLSEENALFLARKAVGWFFIHPITAASILLCIIRSGSSEVSSKASDLLFDPLLLNYSGELREHLDTLVKGGPDDAKLQVEHALKLLDKYLENLRAVGSIPELDPSERERLIRDQRHYEQMQKIHKTAEKSSVLINLVHRSVLLYGSGSIEYRREQDGRLHRHEMKLQNISTSWEGPRLQRIDPLGLQVQLQSFRREQKP